jgi:hypothetical protein
MAAVISQNAVPAQNVSKPADTQAAGFTNGVAGLDLTIPCGDVTASLKFYKAPEDGSIPFMYVDAPPEGQPRQIMALLQSSSESMTFETT